MTAPATGVGAGRTARPRRFSGQQASPRLLVAMAVGLAASVRSPLVAVVMVAEMTGDLRLVPLSALIVGACYLLDNGVARLQAAPLPLLSGNTRRIVLDDEEFKLYEQVYARLAMDAPTPDLGVFPQAPGDILLQRIDRRGIPFEKYIDAAYPERLGEAYTRYFHQYTASPLLIVNTAEIDPANNSRDFDDLFETIRKTQSGRHYVNPVRA